MNQIKQAEKYCIDQKQISSLELMDRAAENCFKWIIKHYQIKNKSFIIFSGNGNNGGDGLSLARFLYTYGVQVSVYILNISNHFSDEFLIQKNRIIKNNINLHHLYEGEKIPNFDKKNYIIDAIFGIGLNREIGNFWKNFIDILNKKKFSLVISIDIPSGMFIETNNNHKSKKIIKATHTLTFYTPKIPFFLPDYEEYVGKWWVINLGVHKDYFQKIYTKNYFVDCEYIRSIKKRRKKFSHKGNYGHGLIIGGSYGMIGSMVLAGKACLRSGIGKLTIYTPHCGYSILQNGIPEAIIKTDKKKFFISKIDDLPKITSVGIGMGLGMHPKTQYALESFLLKISKRKKTNLILDADAINIIANKLDMLRILPKNTILTPHPKELFRLFGTWKNDYEKLNLLKEMSNKYHIFFVLKGFYSIISTPSGELYFNSTGNPGMSTAGSGDVLSGMIVSFLSQGYSEKDACIFSVYLHGLSGDIAKNELCEESIISSDIVDCIAKSFQKI
ncbi:NAD(P)H-hydrate dehydratase [Blattabacterium cuenoti]|uniref:NAD(P)H-hydrate dehydratase n=1 Tax=Blattabacterium cuenoti TaxID=1653831 RepID=UPI00293BC566|nr:NAD(P)H-hydrate dehydratase [Blattabacterium cuenoti]